MIIVVLLVLHRHFKSLDLEKKMENMESQSYKYSLMIRGRVRVTYMPLKTLCSCVLCRFSILGYIHSWRVAINGSTCVKIE